MLHRHMVGGLVSLVILALSWLPVTSATGEAGLYERIGPVYQTYRIAVAAWGAQQKKILPGLAKISGSHPNGGANYREMINHIDYIGEDGLDENWYKSKGIDMNDPDPDSAVHKINYDTQAKTGLMQLQLIMEGERTKWNNVIDRMRTVLKDAHIELRTQNKLSTIDHNRDRLKACHIQILKLRSTDMVGGNDGTKGLGKAIKDNWPTAVVEVQVKEWEHDPQVRIFTLNAKKIVSSSPPGLFTFRDVKKYIKAYGQDVGTNTAKKHFAIIRAHITTKVEDAKWRKNPGCV